MAEGSSGPFFPPGSHQFNNNSQINSLHGKSRNQLKGSCTPGKHEIKYTETVDKFKTSSQCNPYLQLSTIQLGGNLQALSIFLGRKRIGLLIKYPKLPGASHRTGFCLAHLRVLTRLRRVQPPRKLVRTETKVWAYSHRSTSPKLNTEQVVET